ncbi:MAG: hypothetical protein AAB116_12510 [Candidatus Poribacteria bacterium]
MPEKIPSYGEIIEEELSKVSDTIDIDTFIDKILEIKPSPAKNPRSSIRQHINDNLGVSLIFLDKETIAPFRVVMLGVRFRITLSKLETDEGAIFASPHFIGLDRLSHGEGFTFMDESGSEIPASIVTIKQKDKDIENEKFDLMNIFSRYPSEKEAISLKDWMGKHNAKAGDSIIFTFESWNPMCFKLEFEPKKETLKHKAEIELKDKEFADIVFDMLEKSAREGIYIYKSIAIAYMSLSDPKGYPGNHWYSVLAQDERMEVNSFDIRYAEERGLWEELVGSERSIKKPKLDSQQKEQVYIFKASLKYRTEIWRRIEIKGKQTLSDFDGILRTAFNHDHSDHMAGFWKLIRRGNTNRTRKVDLGDIDPDGEGDASDITIAEVGLSVDDKLIYVYDFGDWIEHEIVLEAINPSQKGVKYPKIVEQNIPRKRYCRDCKAKGKKTEASYICIECTDDEQERVYVCEECLDVYHEDHYADEILS